MADTLPPPKSIGVLLFPGFQALDVFGPLDIINVLSYTQAVSVSLISATLSPVSTLPPPSHVNYPALFLAQPTSQSVVPTHTLSSAPELDILVVPGGYGTRAPLDEELDFIRTRFPSLRYVISVCTGSVLLARAGVLEGKRATSNKKAWEWVATTHGEGKVEWIQKARWVEDGKVWTTSGISAGIDGMLMLVERCWGRETADEIAAGMEYERTRSWEEDPWAGFWEERRREERKEKEKVEK